MAVARGCRSRSQPALEIDGGGAKAGTRGSQRERLSRRGTRVIREIPVRREAAPVLVAAIEQVEQRGPANQRHPDVSDGKAAGALAQEGLDARPRVQSECRD